MVGRPSFDHLLRHELTHVEQWRTLGVTGFLRIYLTDYFRGRRNGLTHYDAYLAISLECEARARADAQCRPAAPISQSEVQQSQRRLEGFVAQLSDSDLRLPSRLPGWTVGHVLAHIALNAEALSRVLEAIAQQREAFMYESSKQRDLDIDALSGATQAAILDRIRTSNHRFDQVVAACDSQLLASATFRRAPGSDPFSASDLLARRLREVEVHAADCGHRSYTYESWSDAFVDAELATLIPTAASRVSEPIHLIDEHRFHHTIGNATMTPAVRATRRQIAAWLLSRQQPAHLPALTDWAASR